MASAFTHTPPLTWHGEDPRENPYRQYKWFRPRQAARGFNSVIGSAGNATIFLFNNSTTHYLVVRNFWFAVQSGNDQVNVAYVPAPLPATNQNGTVAPLTTTTQTLPGQLLGTDWATTVTPDHQFLGQVNGTFPVMIYPFAVITPQFALAWQNVTTHHTMLINVIYEAITPKQLDFFD